MLRGSEWKHVGAGGSMQKARKTVEANQEPVEAMEVVGKWVGDREGVGRGAGGSGEVREVRKRSGRPWESAEEAGRHRR